MNICFCIDELQTPEGISEEQRAQELAAMEDARIVILNNLEELEQKIKDINDQMDESSREVKNMSSFFSFFNKLKFCCLQGHRSWTPNT